MRRTPLAAALVVLLAAPAAAPAAPVHELQADGRVVVREDRFAPAVTEPGPRAVVARAPLTGARAAAARRTVPGELRRMLLAGAIDQPTHDRWREVFEDSRLTWKRLSGRRRAELGAVIRTVQNLAASGRLTVTRSPSAFLTLARNRAWWASGPLLGFGRRVGFAGSRLVWQSYPGQGLQIQWLGTFGKANAFFSTGEHDDELRELLAEAERLAVQRAGGHAWEYLFRFDGGRPPWVSALAQGTALQAFSRAAIRLGEPRLFEVARGGLGIFRAAPPEGVRAPGDHYLIYSSLPRLRVLNGFVQALNGLLDFARLANDEEGRALFAAGEARLRAELARYDTGAWSMYSTRRESDLGYHKLVRDFLRGLCARLADARDRASAVQLDPSGGAAPAPAAPAFPDPAPYCDTAERFTGYLRTPPELEVQPSTLRQGRRGAVRFKLSKISTVTFEVRRRGALIHRIVVRLGAGRRSLPLKPDKAGPLRVRLRAVDLAGNVGRAAGVVRVAPRR
ncbi:MAG TPA: D-glucuronyl C5-epimerase family protein [Baekduia sp.]|nr:D-glucuronyl C5-epimerase family protein [Baekduia sp.]